MSRKRTKKDIKSSYAVVGEGITEKIYFDRLKYNENITNFHIRPELPSSSNFQSIFKKADELLDKGVDKVYVIFDLDKIIDDDNIDDFNSAKNDRAKKIRSKKLVLILCNPCFEYWFLLHYRYCTPNYRGCSTVTDDLKTHIDNYEKSQKFLQGADIYKILKPELETAGFPNSVQSHKTRSKEDGPRRAFSMVHMILRDLEIC